MFVACESGDPSYEREAIKLKAERDLMKEQMDEGKNKVDSLRDELNLYRATSSGLQDEVAALEKSKKLIS